MSTNKIILKFIHQATNKKSIQRRPLTSVNRLFQKYLFTGLRLRDCCDEWRGMRGGKGPSSEKIDTGSAPAAETGSLTYSALVLSWVLSFPISSASQYPSLFVCQQLWFFIGDRESVVQLPFNNVSVICYFSAGILICNQINVGSSILECL